MITKVCLSSSILKLSSVHLDKGAVPKIGKAPGCPITGIFTIINFSTNDKVLLSSEAPPI